MIVLVYLNNNLTWAQLKTRLMRLKFSVSIWVKILANTFGAMPFESLKTWLEKIRQLRVWIETTCLLKNIIGMNVFHCNWNEIFDETWIFYHYSVIQSSVMAQSGPSRRGVLLHIHTPLHTHAKAFRSVINHTRK